ncbi:MAG: hypothetical protein MJE63_00865 [Proteobacteria bacterium]|nr:hypothetical protein [Pseudomonadota bacterium]
MFIYIIFSIPFFFVFLLFYFTIRDKQKVLQWLLVCGMLSIVPASSYLGNEKFGLNRTLFYLLKYADEISIVLVLTLIPFTPKLQINFDKYLLLITSFGFIGFFSAFIYGRDISTIALATFLTLKPFFIFFIFKTLRFDTSHKSINRVLQLLFLIVVVGGAIDIFFAQIYRPIISSYRTDVRFGITYISGFFWHPSSQAILASLLIIYYSAFKKYSEEPKSLNDKIRITALFLFVIGATRIKQIIALILALGVRKISIRGLIVGIVLAVGLFWGYKTFLPNHYNRYLGYIDIDKNARQALTITSIKIATDYFPLGTGFGTFASPVSRDYYSPVYDQYMISNVWGLSRTMGSFICDTFWPMVLGETGFLGLLLYLLFWTLIVLEVAKKRRNNYISEFFTMYFIFIFTTSLATSALLNKEGYVLFAVAGYLLNPIHQKAKQELENLKHSKGEKFSKLNDKYRLSVRQQ